jgi:DNA-binding Lrp family transcriptional regulator
LLFSNHHVLSSIVRQIILLNSGASLAAHIGQKFLSVSGYITVNILEQTTTAAGILVDKIDLNIIISLFVNCRTPYRTIASTVGISTNAVKTRVKKMVDKGIIQKFIVMVNPAIFGYEKQCFLIVRNIEKIIAKEKDYVFNQLNLLGDVRFHARQLGGDAVFSLLVRPEAEEKIELMTSLLKPAAIEYRFAIINPPSMNVNISDLKIIKCLLSNARMEIAQIAKESSISPRTVTRRVEKMGQHHIIDFRIIRDMSSMNLTGYIEFLLMVTVNRSVYGEIVERMYREMQEYLVNIPINITGSELIVAIFFCSNIPTVDLIVTRIKSYDGVQGVELFITTKVAYYQEWLERQINKTLRSHSKTTTTIRLPAVK